MSRYSIAIAGCGVAGLAAGALLARAGHRVVAFDRMQQLQPIGSGLILQPVGLAVLDVLGAGAPIRALGAPIRRLFGRVQPSDRVVLDVRYSARGLAAPEGLAVHRGALFEILLAAAQVSGVEIVPARVVKGAAGGRIAFAGGGQSATFDLVIDALGVRSCIARPQPPAPLPFGALWANLEWPADAGFDPHTLEQRYRAARNMAGVLPIGRQRTGAPNLACYFWSLKHDAFAAWKARGLDAWKNEALALWPQTAPLLAQLQHPEQLIFASYSHAALRSPAAVKLAHIGDSWHSASPQLGQGANMALLDALALARAIDGHAQIDAALSAYAAARAGHIGVYQLASFMFTPAYQSDSDALAFVRDWIAAPLSRIWPAPAVLAGLVSGAIGAPLNAIDALGDG
jgi:2-polyprenyl-6-methoxyphenol hydroxylase-like FAD-dependent oxidoreductase